MRRWIATASVLAYNVLVCGGVAAAVGAETPLEFIGAFLSLCFFETWLFDFAEKKGKKKERKKKIKRKKGNVSQEP